MKAFEKFLAVETMKKMDGIHHYYKELMSEVMEKEIWQNDDEVLKLVRFFAITEEIKQAQKYVEENMDDLDVQDILKIHREDIFYIEPLMKCREKDILCVENGILEKIMDVIQEISQQVLNLEVQQQKFMEDWEEGNAQIEYEIREESEESIKEKLDGMKR